MVSSYVREPSLLGKGQVYPDVPRQTYPPHLLHEIQPLLARGEKLGRAVFAQMTSAVTDAKLRSGHSPALENVRANCIRDETFAEIACHLQRRKRCDLLMVYLGGIDNAGHRFWQHFAPQSLDFRVGGAARRAFGRILPGCYRYIDAAIGRIVAASPADASFIVVSDHSVRATHTYGPGHTGTHRGDDPGIFLAVGPGVSQGRCDGLLNRLQALLRERASRRTTRRRLLADDAEWFRALAASQKRAPGQGYARDSARRRAFARVVALLGRVGLLRYVSVFDVAPLSLHLMGIPVPRDMDGDVPLHVLSASFRRENPVRYSDAECSRKCCRLQPVRSLLDDGVVQRLKSLGYI
jgi:hypothetical protein